MNENELVTLLERGWDCCTRLTVASDPHDIITELFGVGLGHGEQPSSSVLDATDQMSPIRAAVPRMTSTRSETNRGSEA